MTIELDRIYVGDCVDVMAKWPDEFIQTCVTSPPYWGLRDYGVLGQIGMEDDVDKYLRSMVDVFSEVKRVMRPDGTLWLNMGDSYYNYRPGSNDDARPQGFDSERINPRGLPSFPSKRKDRLSGLKEKDLIGIPWRVAMALQADGWYLRSDIIWSKPNPMPESVTDRPTKAHEYLFLLAKSERYFYDADAIKERASYPEGPHSPEAIKSPYGQGFTRANKVPSGWDQGTGSHRQLTGRYKPLPDGQANLRKKRDKQRGHGRRHEGFNDRWDAMTREEQCTGMRNKRTVWTVATAPFSEAHFATFPPALIKPCILAGSPMGGVVLDPFMGAGTTALVASMYGRRFVGIEINPEYAKMAEKRIANEKSQMKFA